MILLVAISATSFFKAFLREPLGGGGGSLWVEGSFWVEGRGGGRGGEGITTTKKKNGGRRERKIPEIY